MNIKSENKNRTFNNNSIERKTNKEFNKKSIAFFLCLLVIFSLFPAVAFAKTTSDTSEKLNVKYRTQNEIREFALEHSIKDTSVLYYELPAFSAPYVTGKLSDETRKTALNALNIIRFIAGLDSNVAEDEDYSEAAQAAALVNAVNYCMTHYPAQPWDMDKKLYSKAYEGAMSSNIAWGYNDLVHSVLFAWMADEDSENIISLGHRRWMLNPAMSAAGFGLAAQESAHTAMYAVDGNAAGDEYNVSWPAQNMPTYLFREDYPWSLSVGKYVDPGSVYVELIRINDGSRWTFSSAYSDGFFNVDNSGCGQPGCVIFRPDGMDAYLPGDHFDVNVFIGDSQKISYSVDFFDMDDLFPEDESAYAGYSESGSTAAAEMADKTETLNKADNEEIRILSNRTFAPLMLKSTEQTKDSVSLIWDKAEGAKKYVIYGNLNGNNNKLRKIATVKGLSKKIKKISNMKISAGKTYKFIVKAYNRKGKMISTSDVIYVTSSGGNTGNYKKVKTEAGSRGVILSKGETLKIGAEGVAAKDAPEVREYVPIRYESANPKVAAVNPEGVIKALKKGKCTIYAYAQNGVVKNIKVTVK